MTRHPLDRKMIQAAERLALHLRRKRLARLGIPKATLTAFLDVVAQHQAIFGLDLGPPLTMQETRRGAFDATALDQS